MATSEELHLIQVTAAERDEIVRRREWESTRPLLSWVDGPIRRRHLYLDRLTVGAQQQLTQEILKSMDDWAVREITEAVFGQLNLAVAHRIAAEQLANDVEEQVYEVPVNWFEHLKLDKPWVRRLFRKPIKTMQLRMWVRWSRHATRPLASLPHDQRLGVVVYQEQSEVGRSW